MQESQSNNESSQAPIKIYAIGAIALITLVGGVIYFNGQAAPEAVIKDTPVAIASPAPVIAAPEELIEEPVVELVPVTEPVAIPQPQEIIPAIPVAQVPKTEPLPTLDNSDEFVMAKASQLSWLPEFAKQLVKKDLARNFVTFVDNASRGDLAMKFSPVEKPLQKFLINEVADDMYIDPHSYKRYDVYVDMLNSINFDVAIAHLKELTPILDEAYMELGYEKGAFVPTLEQAIEEMLQAPIIRNPIKVVAPSAMYKYADPQLENLSDLQKLMLRMGPDNIAKLRPKLQQAQLALSELSN